MLPPVFGTAQPPSGIPGAIRRYAYHYSEGRTAHWLLLVLGDRVDAWEHHLKSLLTLHPDNPITETGVKAEFTRHGLRSRIGQHRTDLKHQWLGPVIVAGPRGVATWLVVSPARGSSRPGWCPPAPGSWSGPGGPDPSRARPHSPAGSAWLHAADPAGCPWAPTPAVPGDDEERSAAPLLIVS